MPHSLHVWLAIRTRGTKEYAAHEGIDRKVLKCSLVMAGIQSVLLRTLIADLWVELVTYEPVLRFL